MLVSSSKLVNFIQKPSSYFKKLDNNGQKRSPEDKNTVLCSYSLTWTKLYVVLIVWLNYVFDVYVSYIRQFGYMNRFESVPDELKPFYSQMAFEEAKITYMFRTLVSLEMKYHHAIHLTVVYLTNVYCTLWWIASKITQNLLTRAIVFNLMTSIVQYRAGDVVFHANLILASYSFGEGACRFCHWVKEMLKKVFTHVSSLSFLEEVLMSILLTLMTTPMCIILFLAYRIYKTVLFPIIIEERLAQYVKLGDGDLLTMINNLCLRYNYRINSVYISQKLSDAHRVKLRGFNDKKYLVLGSKLVDGHLQNETATLYSLNEIAAAIIRAQAEYYVTIPTYDIVLEATHWVTIIVFAVCLTFGFCGGSRLGFVPSPPQVIAFTMSRHLSIPILLVVKILKNNLSRQKHFVFDGYVCETGFGEHLLSYIGKECRLTYRCPVEDPFYTYAYSDRPPIIYRIRNLQARLEFPSSPRPSEAVI